MSKDKEFKIGDKIYFTKSHLGSGEENFFSMNKFYPIVKIEDRCCWLIHNYGGLCNFPNESYEDFLKRDRMWI